MSHQKQVMGARERAVQFTTSSMEQHPDIAVKDPSDLFDHDRDYIYKAQINKYTETIHIGH